MDDLTRKFGQGKGRSSEVVSMILGYIDEDVKLSTGAEKRIDVAVRTFLEREGQMIQDRMRNTEILMNEMINTMEQMVVNLGKDKGSVQMLAWMVGLIAMRGDAGIAKEIRKFLETWVASSGMLKPKLVGGEHGEEG